MLAYNFADNHVPGVADYEEQAYWRDLGTIDAYYDAHFDVLGERPRFNLFNPQWFINSSTYQGPSPRILSGDIKNSTIATTSCPRSSSALVTCCPMKPGPVILHSAPAHATNRKHLSTGVLREPAQTTTT